MTLDLESVCRLKEEQKLRFFPPSYFHCNGNRVNVNERSFGKLERGREYLIYGIGILHFPFKTLAEIKEVDVCNRNFQIGLNEVHVIYKNHGQESVLARDELEKKYTIVLKVRAEQGHEWANYRWFSAA